MYLQLKGKVLVKHLTYVLAFYCNNINYVYIVLYSLCSFWFCSFQMNQLLTLTFLGATLVAFASAGVAKKAPGTV